MSAVDASDRHARSLGWRPGWAGLALVLLLGWGVACGRVGYDPVLVGQTEREDGDARDAAAPSRDMDSPRTEPAPDGPSPPPVDAGIDQRPVDTAATPIDTAPPPVDTAPPPVDTAPPRDQPPDIASVDMEPTCPTFPPNDLIADLEDGTLNLNKVGARGGTDFHLVNVANGTIRNVAQPHCGQRALEIQGGPPPRVPLIQGTFIPMRGGIFDASGYSGIAITVRATRATAVRLKLPNDDTVGGGNDHFQVMLTAGPTWSHLSFPWAAFAQTGAAMQFPRFDVSKLFAVEMSVSVAADVTVWVDQIAFTR